MAALQTTRRSSVQLQIPTLSLAQSFQLSHSQGNLQQMPAAGSSRQRSQSVDILSHLHLAHLTSIASSTSTATSPASANPPPLPIIKVEMEGGENDEGGFGSGSSSISLSDDLSQSSASSLNWSHDIKNLRVSRTPPPTVNSRRSSTGDIGGKIMPSASDQNLYKSSTAPKVPPRPQAQEILSRCTTITRKNASRGRLSPTQTEIQSRWSFSWPQSVIFFIK